MSFLSRPRSFQPLVHFKSDASRGNSGTNDDAGEPKTLAALASASVDALALTTAATAGEPASVRAVSGVWTSPSDSVGPTVERDEPERPRKRTGSSMRAPSELMKRVGSMFAPGARKERDALKGLEDIEKERWKGIKGPKVKKSKVKESKPKDEDRDKERKKVKRKSKLSLLTMDFRHATAAAESVAVPRRNGSLRSLPCDDMDFDSEEDDIRRPSGLGSAVSLSRIGSDQSVPPSPHLVVDSPASPVTAASPKTINSPYGMLGFEGQRATWVRVRAASSPNLRDYDEPSSLPTSSTGAQKTMQGEATVELISLAVAHAPSPPPSYTLPLSITTSILSFLPRTHLPSIALVSRHFCNAARATLYKVIDMDLIAPVRAEELLATLAGEYAIQLAGLVKTFRCRRWPGYWIAPSGAALGYASATASPALSPASGSWGCGSSLDSSPALSQASSSSSGPASTHLSSGMGFQGIGLGIGYIPLHIQSKDARPRANLVRGFERMENVEFLTLPAFDSMLMRHHTARGLKNVEFLCPSWRETVEGRGDDSFVGWLGRHPMIEVLRFPYLVDLPGPPDMALKIDTTPTLQRNDRGPRTAPVTAHSNRKDMVPFPTSSLLGGPPEGVEVASSLSRMQFGDVLDEPSKIVQQTVRDDNEEVDGFLPRLEVLQATPAVVVLLFGSSEGSSPILPRRPLRTTLTITSTLYTGLRPSSVMALLMERNVEVLEMRFGPGVDKRTWDKALRASGAFLGGGGDEIGGDSEIGLERGIEDAEKKSQPSGLRELVVVFWGSGGPAGRDEVCLQPI